VTIRIERDDAAAIVTLDNPEVRNALDLHTVRELGEAVADLAQDRSVLGLVLTGNGAFCAGANLRGVASRSSSASSSFERRGAVEEVAHELIRRLVGFPLPTVAAIDGAAVGMGMDLALACDSRLIGPGGWLMQGWGRVGLIGGTGGDLMLRLLNPGIAWKLIVEQPRVGAVDAERWGLGEVVTDATARDAAIRRINDLARLSRQALEDYVILHRAQLRRLLDEHLRTCADMQADLLAAPDFSERVARLLGKDKAAGTGSEQSPGPAVATDRTVSHVKARIAEAGRSCIEGEP
jgi:enoyl-CoA hydratase/carnithine racemase